MACPICRLGQTCRLYEVIPDPQHQTGQTASFRCCRSCGGPVSGLNAERAVAARCTQCIRRHSEPEVPGFLAVRSRRFGRLCRPRGERRRRLPCSHREQDIESP
jgi:hypothetical protein